MNNPSCDSPKYTLKRDVLLKEFSHDAEVKLADLPLEIAKRNKIAASEPIVLHYEYKNCCNLTLIDTPGLDEEDFDKDQSVIHLLKPSNRLIICVEACRDGLKMDIVDFVKKVDPELTRTVFVNAKFQALLQTLASTREVNKFLSTSTPADVKAFYVTFPSSGVRSKFLQPEKFQEKIYQAYKRDMNTLEMLQFDKR
jgi:hypothetical protein